MARKKKQSEPKLSGSLTPKQRAYVLAEKSGSRNISDTIILIEVLSEWGLKMEGSPESNYRDLRDAWSECTAKCLTKLTKKRRNENEDRKTLLEDLKKIVRSKKLIPFPQQDIDPSALVYITKNQTKEENTMAAKKKATTKKATTKKTVTKKKATTKKKTASKRKPGVGAFIQEQIKKGKDNQSIADMIPSKFPHSSAGTNEVAWYRSKMRREGVIKD